MLQCAVIIDFGKSINQSPFCLCEVKRKQVTNAKIKHNVKLSNNKTHTMETAKDLAVIESSSDYQSYFNRRILLSFSKIKLLNEKKKF